MEINGIYKTKSNMEHIQKQCELLDGVKHKIKDGEYKMMMENLAEIRKKTAPLFVSFISVKAQARVRCNIFDGGDKKCVCEDISSKCDEEFDFDGAEDDEIATSVNVTAHLDSCPLVRRVVDNDDERHEQASVKSCAYIPRSIYETMKKQGFAVNKGEMLFYLEDVE